MEETKLERTPNELIQKILQNKRTIRVAIFVFEGDALLVLTVRLKFWHRLFSVLFSDYKYKLQNELENDCRSFLPEGLEYKVVIEL